MRFKTPSRTMAATITVWLLSLYTIVLLLPVLNFAWIKPDAKFSDALVQTLLILLAGAIGYYIGTTRASDDKNETIRQQAATAAVVAASTPTTPAGVPIVKVDDATPVNVQEAQPKVSNPQP